MHLIPSSRSRIVRIPLIAIAVLTALSASGCGGGIAEPELAQVKGKITINNEPAVGVDVLFSPSESGGKSKSEAGGVSSARTDAEGQFELIYKGTEKGAVIGKHMVQIRRDEANVDAPPSPPIPPEYNNETTLTADVVPGDNEINYDLKLPTQN